MRIREKLFQLWLALSLGLVMALLAIPGTMLAVDLLTNGPFESFQSYNGKNWRGFPEKYGQGWTVKVIDEDGLHFMDSDTFGQFSTAVYGVPYLNYRLEGTYAQAFASRHHYNFVFSQTVAVVNGQDYAFGGKIVTFWKGPGPEVDHTKIFKRVGLDPTGGLNYDGPNVIWTDWDSTDNAWTSPAIAATAQANQMTVFFQIKNIADDVGSAYLNTGYIDNFKFELAPVATLNLPGQAAPGPVNVTWSVTINDGFWNLWGYDVEYKDSVAGTWQTIQTRDGANGQDTSYTLNAQAGKTYTFRVRPWQQRAPSGDPTTTALPGVWVEKSITIGEAVVGQVTNHTGLGLSGVTVSVNGTATSTLSANGGNYALPTEAAGTFDIVANNFDNLLAPPATAVTIPSSSTAGVLTITLRPTGTHQAIVNNDFETDLSNWNVSDGSAASASTADYHTGNRSLWLSNTVSVSQTGAVIEMRSPLLSFWYKNDASFTVEFLGEGIGGSSLGIMALSPAQTQILGAVSDWTYFTMDLGTNDVYSGDVGVNFSYTGGAGANIFIDEVSIAAGTYKIYLPIVFKN